MATMEAVGTRDAAPVFSRISWGALLAGLFVTLAVFVLLSTLGVAVGVSSADAASRDTIATGAGVWAVATALVAFLCGGCVVSRFTTGESRAEAVVYGVVMWGAAFAMILWATGSVLRTGATMAVGSMNVAANAAPQSENWEQAARRANLTDAQVNQMRAEMPTAARVQDVSAAAAWWSFAGVALSMAAAIGGAVMGAGPNPSLGGVQFPRTSPSPAPGL
ncbi:hypothetical protein [Gemmata sp.]|uniref:hypothetical protein n=1 Tax=Gemmata sp. TaxID=1914242 RepID=UPI003F6F3C0F